jgi:hypothetical protein
VCGRARARTHTHTSLHLTTDSHLHTNRCTSNRVDQYSFNLFHCSRRAQQGTATGLLMNQGFIVHSAIHAARHDMHCVVHCHHQPTVAVAMTETRILPMSQEIVGVFDSIRYHPFEGTALDLEERERMARSLGPNASILILENHGPLTGGASIADAMWLMCVHALLRAFSLCEDTLASYNRTCTCTYICTHTHTHTHTGTWSHATVNISSKLWQRWGVTSPNCSFPQMSAFARWLQGRAPTQPVLRTTPQSCSLSRGVGVSSGSGVPRASTRSDHAHDSARRVRVSE